VYSYQAESQAIEPAYQKEQVSLAIGMLLGHLTSKLNMMQPQNSTQTRETDSTSSNSSTGSGSGSASGSTRPPKTEKKEKDRLNKRMKERALTKLEWTVWRDRCRTTARGRVEY